MEMIISSKSNPKIKFVRAIKFNKGHIPEGLFLVEGIRHIGEAFESGFKIETIYYAPDLLISEFAMGMIEKAAEAGISIVATTAQVFQTLSERENPQGILAVLRKKEKLLTELDPRNFPWGVAIVSPQDPGNLGTILRTIDAVGASGVILLENSVDAFHPTAIRAGMGTHFWKPIVQSNINQFSEWVQQYNYHIYGTSAHAEKSIESITRYESPAMLLMGSEKDGLPDNVAVLCEMMVKLPMHGRATSLNLAVATGILLYDMLGKGIK
jgi:RNA methyltransferase, TrmH family